MLSFDKCTKKKAYGKKKKILCKNKKSKDTPCFFSSGNEN